MLRLKRGVRIQFERMSNVNVLLFPEGVVELNDSAHAILSRLPRRVPDLKQELRSHYNANELHGIDEFIHHAISSSWIEKNE